MSGALIGKLALPLVLEALRTGLAKVDHPAAQGAREALETVQNAVANGGIRAEQLGEVNRHLEKMTELEVAERQKAVEEINASLRAEVASNDIYVRRMRPTFGYLMAITWSAQMLGIAYIIVFNTQAAGAVLQAMESLGTIWAVALSVMGIYVYQRSAEKKAGLNLGGLLPTVEPDPASESGQKQTPVRRYND